MDQQDHIGDRFDTSMQVLGKRLEVMRKKNEASFLNSEILTLESELRQLELQQEGVAMDEEPRSERPRSEQKPRRHLPDIPRGRRVHFDTEDPPLLNMYDDSSIGGSYTPLPTPQPGTSRMGETGNKPVTSTPNIVESKPQASGGVKVKPATFDGTGSWLDYRAHFDAVAEINRWNATEKGLYLAVSLRGQAQGVFGNISTQSRDYDKLVKALEERFAPPNQTELYRVQLRERRQTASETLSALGQDIRRLTNLAYPTAPCDVRETLAKEQFIDALHSSDIRLRVKQARPSDLNDAVRHAVELEAYNRTERKKQEGQGYLFAANASETKSQENSDSTSVSMENLTETLKLIQDELKSIKTQRPEYRRYKPYGQWKQTQGTPRSPERRPFRRRCYTCGSTDHIQRDCKQKLPEPGAKQQEKENVDEEAVKVSGKRSSGLFVSACVNGKPLNSLVDTGATLTIISSRVWETVGNSSSTLNSFEQVISTASGNPIEVKGKTNVHIKVSKSSCYMEVIIADIDNEAILGLDFLERNNCKIDIAQGNLMIQDETIKLDHVGYVGCSRIVAKDMVQIPPRSQRIIKASMTDSTLEEGRLCIIEPAESFLEKGSALVAKSLSYSQNEIPVRVMNITDEMCQIYPGTNIAKASSVVEVQNIKSKMPQSKHVPSHLSDLYQRTVEGMNNEQQKKVANLLNKYSSVFSENDNDIGRTGVLKHRIPTKDVQPIKQPLRRVPYHMQKEMDEQIDKLLEKDVITPSKSPWASGIVLVKKKDGSKRFCVDYRRLNDVTIKDAYPLPRIDESLDQLAGSKWFSCLDMNSGYWQVELDQDDRKKTAFISRKGLFEFKVLPFGLCNAPATFERLVEIVLAGLHWTTCLVYLDDIIVCGKTFDEMVKNLDEVFARLQGAGLKLKARKCQLFSKRVEFLGHVISEDGIRTDPKKTECVRTWPEPTNVKEMRSFLGFCSYYRRFIFRFSEIAKPLHKLTQKDIRFKWTKECQDAFQTLKLKLVNAPVLAHPDFNQGFILDVDACDQSIGAVISQKINGEEHAIGFASRTLTKTERAYCVTRKELLALVTFVKHFKHYLYGKRFLVRTDHSSLRWLMNFKNPEGQIARWIETLSSYDMKVEHRPGRLHQNADGVSRIPCSQCGINKEARTSVNVVGSSNIDRFDIKAIQDEDRDISLIKSWLEKGIKPDTKAISMESYSLKALCNQWRNLEIQEGVLVRRFEDTATNAVITQAIVPQSQRRTVLEFSHDVQTAGHLGMNKTLSKVRQNYYWPGLSQDVKTYVTGCETCQKGKEPIPTKRAPMQVSRSGYPMERIAVDILGELPVTERENKYVLVISDYFTKWTESFPMKNMEAATVARIMVEEVFTRFGIPDQIHSDQGRQFESRLFAEMCELLEIDKTRTTPYHPKSDGMVERFNKTLCSMLRAYINDNHSNWDLLLPYVMMAYRSTAHESTGLSPNMLLFGHNTRTPLDLIYKLPPNVKHEPPNSWVWELQERLESAHAYVRETTGLAIERQKKNHDKKLSYEGFNVGDWVFVYFPVKKTGQSHKFTPFWRGPFEVMEKMSEVLLKINCGRNRGIVTIHIDRVRKVRNQILRGESESREDSEPAEAQVEHSDPPNEPPEVSETTDREEPLVETRYKRVVRKPKWFRDYISVLSICREMVNTKEMPRKKSLCPNCKKEVKWEEYLAHTRQCGRPKPEPKTKDIECSVCKSTFSKRANLNKHVKRYHPVSSTCAAASSKEFGASSEQSGFDELGSDPEVNVDYEDVRSSESENDSEGSDHETVDSSKDEADEDLTLGRTHRKRTEPEKVRAPKRQKKENAVELPKIITEKAMVDDRKISGSKETMNWPKLHVKDMGVQVTVTGHRCDPCGITFDDEIAFAIHRGWHSHGDPFLCNMCGERHQNKYEFISHMVKGHGK